MNAGARDELVKMGPVVVPRLIAAIRQHIGDQDQTVWQSAYDVLERLGTAKGALLGDCYPAEEKSEVDLAIAKLVAGDEHESIVVEGVEFMRIPAGWSVSGTNVKRDIVGIAPPPALRRVWLDQFWISKYEITRGQVESLGVSLVIPRGPGPIPLEGPNFSTPRWPAGVRWATAVEWCEKFSSVIPDKLSLRCTLPREVQWEKACRGDFGAHFPWGFGPAPGSFYPMVSAGEGSFPNTRRPYRLPLNEYHIGMIEFDVSPYGVIDMAGSAREWCLDRLEQPYGPPVVSFPARDKYAPYVVKGGDTGYDAGLSSRSGFGRSGPFKTGFRPVLIHNTPRTSRPPEDSARTDPPGETGRSRTAPDEATVRESQRGAR